MIGIIAVLCLGLGGAWVPAHAGGWTTIRLEGTSLRIAWPSGKRAKWVGAQGSYLIKERDESRRLVEHRFSARVVRASKEMHWDEILNRESGGEEGHLLFDDVKRNTLVPSGAEAGGFVITGDAQTGERAGFPTRRWTLARKDAGGTLRNFRELFVLRAPAYYILLRYDYSGTGAGREHLDVFERMLASLEPFDAPEPGRPKARKRHRR